MNFFLLLQIAFGFDLFFVDFLIRTRVLMVRDQVSETVVSESESHWMHSSSRFMLN